MNIKDNIKIIMLDRGYLLAVISLLIAMVVIVVLGGLQIRPSELQVPIKIRYSSGIINFDREKWYYLLNFLVFAIFTAAMHIGISLKLYNVKGRQMALSFVWLSVVVLIIAAFFIYGALSIVLRTQ